ncbi:MAG: hypothetical protein XD36_2692 [Halomonas sp. 54_146]|nr:MAG: hypothetical protein XD36_2692 [Halomonas sp. 54_146]
MNIEKTLEIFYYIILGRKTPPQNEELAWHIESYKKHKNIEKSFNAFINSDELKKKITANPKLLIEKRGFLKHIERFQLINEINCIDSDNVKNYLFGEIYLSQGKLNLSLDSFKKISKEFYSNHTIKIKLISYLKSNNEAAEKKILSLACFGINFSKEDIEKIENGKKIALIDFHHNGFLVAALAIAKNLKEQDIFSILVKPGTADLKLDTERDEFNILGIASFDSIVGSETLLFDKLYYHCAGADHRAETYIKKCFYNFPEKISYSDALRNHHQEIKKAESLNINKIHTFCVHHYLTSKGFKKENIETSTIQNYIDGLNKVIKKRRMITNIPSKSIMRNDKISLFCSRYWGENGYSFDPNDIAKCWFETIKTENPTNNLLVIKSHPLESPKVMEKLEELLQKNKINYCNLEQYFEDHGLHKNLSKIPVEELIGLDILKIESFFTLDSSLPSIISLLKNNKDSIKKIVIGAKSFDDFFKGLPGSQTFKINYEQQLLSCSYILKERFIEKKLLEKGKFISAISFDN